MSAVQGHRPSTHQGFVIFTAITVHKNFCIAFFWLADEHGQIIRCVVLGVSNAPPCCCCSGQNQGRQTIQQVVGILVVYPDQVANTEGYAMFAPQGQAKGGKPHNKPGKLAVQPNQVANMSAAQGQGPSMHQGFATLTVIPMIMAKHMVYRT